MVCLLAERYVTKSNIELGGFQSQLQVSYMSSHTEELSYNETVCLWMTIYIYIYIWEKGIWKIKLTRSKDSFFRSSKPLVGYGNILVGLV